MVAESIQCVAMSLTRMREDLLHFTQSLSYGTATSESFPSFPFGNLLRPRVKTATRALTPAPGELGLGDSPARFF